MGFLASEISEQALKSPLKLAQIIESGQKSAVEIGCRKGRNYRISDSSLTLYVAHSALGFSNDIHPEVQASFDNSANFSG